MPAAISARQCPAWPGTHLPARSHSTATSTVRYFLLLVLVHWVNRWYRTRIRTSIARVRTGTVFVSDFPDDVRVIIYQAPRSD